MDHKVHSQHDNKYIEYIDYQQQFLDWTYKDETEI